MLSVFYFVRFSSCLVMTNNRPYTFRIISYVLFSINNSEQMFFIP